jgi:hypothetical protein
VIELSARGSNSVPRRARAGETAHASGRSWTGAGLPLKTQALQHRPYFRVCLQWPESGIVPAVRQGSIIGSNAIGDRHFAIGAVKRIG